MQRARGGHKGHFTAPRQRKHPCRGMNVIKVTRDYASVFYVNTRQHLYERDNNNNNVTRVRLSRRARNRTTIIFIRFARARHYYVQMIVFRTGRILRILLLSLLPAGLFRLLPSTRFPRQSVRNSN